MTRATTVRLTGSLLAAGLVGLSTQLPLWSMRMKAPQYPKGLRLDAYGTGMVGDIRELNIINHYIGMPVIDPQPSLEMALFPIGIATLVGLCLVAFAHRCMWRASMAALVAAPIGMLAHLQWWLYSYGHSLDPTAPIRLKPFTPPVIGSATLGNFVTSSAPASGTLCLLAAAAALFAAERIARRLTPPPRRVAPAFRPGAAAAAALLVTAAAGSAAAGTTLQARLDAAPPASTVVVEGGVHRGPIVVRGPLTLVGSGGAVIDGGGSGSVVSIEGDDVVLRGFVIRNSGRQVTEEAAGIRVTGNGHRIEHNELRDVYFGIHAGNSRGLTIRYNRIAPGDQYGARPGHGISLWYVRDSTVLDNHVSAARDGIYLSFTERVVVSGNEVRNCRYGVHSMNSVDATVTDNHLQGNLLGAALMQSDRLLLRGNRIEQHREGTAAYGILLKDIGDLVAEGNQILANRVGLYAEAVPTQPSREAIFRDNVIAGNEVGLALQSNAALTMTENRLAENLTDVRALGRQLAAGMRWSLDGRGNRWSQYRGYDANRDGVGDLPHRVDAGLDALAARTPLVAAFLYTPAHLALEAAARMFPLFRQAPLLVDDHPLMSGGSR